MAAGVGRVEGEIFYCTLFYTLKVFECIIIPKLKNKQKEGPKKKNR